MIMADVLKIFLLIVGIQLVFISYWMVAESLFPSWVERSSKQYSGHTMKIIVTGLAIAVPMILIGIGIGKLPNPLAKLAGLVIGLFPVLIGMLGSAGLSRRIGLGLPSSSDAQQPWRRALRGGVVLVFAFLLPVIGWFFVMPLALASGVGAALFAWRQGRKVSLPPPLDESKAATG